MALLVIWLSGPSTCHVNQRVYYGHKDRIYAPYMDEDTGKETVIEMDRYGNMKHIPPCGNTK